MQYVVQRYVEKSFNKKRAQCTSFYDATMQFKLNTFVAHTVLTQIYQEADYSCSLYVVVPYWNYMRKKSDRIQRLK